MTLTEFLLARIAEDEAAARAALDDDGERWATGGLRYDPRNFAHHIARHDPARVLARCEADRRIVEWHKAWPVLAQTRPAFERVDDGDPSRFAMRASQQMAWLTEQEYRERFGDEPPTGPVLRLLALPYADHPDYDEAWRP